MENVVSIITASFNKAAFISETIESVLRQTYANWELLIVDDASTDDTEKVVSAFSDRRIKFIANKANSGANFCRNVGTRQAKGEYIIFLDADDLLHPQCLERRILFAKQNPAANLLVFTMGVFYKTVGDDNRQWIPRSKKPLNDFLQHRLPWSILQPMWKRDFFLKLNGFDESFQRLQDVELHTRALLHPELKLVQFAGEPDCFYRIDEERKNFDVFAFLKRWVNSVVKYCIKFYPQAKALGNDNALLGTFYQTLLQLLFYFKKGKLTQGEFNQLNAELFRVFEQQNPGTVKRLFISVAKTVNLAPFRVPGFNSAVHRILSGGF